MRFIRRSAGIQWVPARGFLHEARATRNWPCSRRPGRFWRVRSRLLLLSLRVSTRPCIYGSQAVPAGVVPRRSRVVSGVALLQGENTSKKAKVTEPARPNQSKLSLPTKSRFERHELFCKQVECATSEVRNTARWKFVGYHV